VVEELTVSTIPYRAQVMEVLYVSTKESSVQLTRRKVIPSIRVARERKGMAGWLAIRHHRERHFFFPAAATAATEGSKSRARSRYGEEEYSKALNPSQ
jgi:hypothetical protein